MPGQSPRIALLVSIGLLGLWLARALLIHVRRASQGERPAGSRSPWVPSTKETGTGFITVFLDTLGIGSFATTTTIFRTGRLVPDELIPGTLNVGHAVSGVLGAFIFIGLVPVASETLLPMILAAVVGAWLGSGLVARCLAIASDWAWAPLCSWPRPSCFSRSSSGSPGGGEALGLYGGRWVVAVLGSFVLGSLMTLGIGLYAPCMIMVSLLGMAPLAAFPITMGSGAFLQPISGARFLREGRYHLSASVGPYPWGIPALLVAAYIVRSLPLTAVRWVVLFVVCFTGVTLLRAGRREAEALRLGAVAPAEAPV